MHGESWWLKALQSDGLNKSWVGQSDMIKSILDKEHETTVCFVPPKLYAPSRIKYNTT